jgi:hypothetical protein
VWIVAADVVSCLCADSTRQVLVDAMATLVKLAEWCATTEAHNVSLQATLTVCRAIDALSSGRCKLLAYDVRAAWAAAVALAADPVTITALAEVTAYLCYALEMEESALAAAAAAAAAATNAAAPFGPQGDNGTTATVRTGLATRSGPQRRRERNYYQNITATQADTLQGGRSVEDVILGSLGTTGMTNASSELDDPSTATTPIIYNSNPKHNGRNTASEEVATTSSLSTVPTGSATAANVDGHEWHHERARRDVNVQALRLGIEERAVRLKAEKHYQSVHLASAAAGANVHPVPEATTNESMPRLRPNGTAVASQSNDDTGDNLDLEELGVVYTVEDDEDPNDAKQNDKTKRDPSTSTTHRHRVALTESQSFQTDYDHNMADSNEDLPHKPTTFQDETSVQQFHRILAEILTAQRDEAVRQTLAGGNDKRTRLPTIGTLRRRPTTSTTAVNGSGTTTAMAGRQTTVRDRLAALRAELVTGPSAVEMERLDRIKRVLGKEGKMVLVVGVVVVAAIALFWIAFVCYGLYMFFRSTPLPLPLPHAQVVPSTTQEIVVRIIREGATTLGNEDNELKASQTELENVAQCVASVFK